MIFKILVVTALLCLSAAVVSGQTVYEIEGTVYGPDTQVAANVIMTLQNHAGAQVDQDITKSDGRYRFSGVVAGVYNILAKPPDTKIQSQVLRIELLNTGAGLSNPAKEHFDFSLKAVPATAGATVIGTVFAQDIPPAAQREFENALGNINKGDKGAAITRLKKAIEIFPSYFLALQQLGLLYVETEKDTQAIEPLKKAIEINPKGAQSHMGLGMAYLNIDQLQDATTELRTALNLDGRLFNAHLYLGIALTSEGKFGEAEKELKEAYALGGPVQARSVHLYLASIYDKKKEYQKAIDELETYLRENPKAANAASIKEAIVKLKGKLK